MWWWLESLGGQIDPPDASVFAEDSGVLIVGPFDVVFPTGLILTVGLTFVEGEGVGYYRFQARTAPNRSSGVTTATRGTSKRTTGRRVCTSRAAEGATTR